MQLHLYMNGSLQPEVLALGEISAGADLDCNSLHKNSLYQIVAFEQVVMARCTESDSSL